MQQMEHNTDQCEFIPSSFSNIEITKTVFENDVFTKYEASANAHGEYIVCNDASKAKKRQKIIVKESYGEYLDFIAGVDKEKDQWIYNVINNTAEQEKVVYRDPAVVVIPSYIWDSKDVKKLHILCIPTDINIRTIRDLSFIHVPLLEHMKYVTLAKIDELYGLKEENLRIFFHYDPSTYHLHAHFIALTNFKSPSSVEYSHEYNSVMFNLSIDSNYYKKIRLNKRILI